MSTKSVVTSVSFVVLILLTGYLSYEFVHRGDIIDARNILINETLAKLGAETSRADALNGTVVQRDSAIQKLEGNVAEQEQVISHQESLINEIKDIAEQQEQEIQHLRDVQASLQEEGKIIVDQWGPTLVLYDNVDIYEKQAPFMELVKNDATNYAKLGMPFIYFKDESRVIEDGLILGSYSTLYNYIYIYRDNTEPRTVYHEIGHIIYQKLFLEVPKNKDIWKGLYQQLKDNDLLSTEYAKTNDHEGFAEEYSVYKTKVKDQPEEVKKFFKQVDDIIN